MAKNKAKTKKSASKRFSVTGSGKIKRYHMSTSHLLTSKTRKRKRKLKQHTTLLSTEEKRTKKMLPYG